MPYVRAVANMKRTRLLKPYKEDGSTTFPARNLPGVYIIYKAGGLLSDPALKYVGFSARDVYKALYRHFQVWNDKQVNRGERGERVTYSPPGAYRVRVIYTRTAAQARELEKALILKHQPPDNPDKLEGYLLTPAGTTMARQAKDAPFTDNMEAPF
jgi:hypothetical protein